MTLHYAELIGEDEKGCPCIVNKGVFSSVEEFVPYRRNGWSGTAEFNADADRIIRFEDVPDWQLEYFAPMLCGTEERKELVRRQNLKRQEKPK